MDTLKIAFPPSTHFTSAPFCQNKMSQPVFMVTHFNHHMLQHFHFPHLGVAGLLDSQVSRRQVTGDGDVELLRRQATFFEERQPRISHYKGTHKHKSREQLAKQKKGNKMHSGSTTNSPGVSRDSFLLAFVLALMSQVTW